MVKFSNKGKPKKSKRMTLQQKYKIERKIKQHHKKSRRAAKKLQNEGLKKKAKMDVIPNLYPFKADLIQAQEQEKINEKLNKGKKKIVQIQEQEAINLPKISIENGVKLFADYSELIERSDVVIQILDARDPEACRNKDIERQIISAGKVLIFLISKSDLVPDVQVNKWKKHLNKQYPTCTFSCKSPNITNTNQLISIIEEKCKNKLGQSIKVGLIGYPLMGKGSIINYFNTNSHYTKPYIAGNQIGEIQFSKNAFLLDTAAFINARNTPSLLFNSQLDHKDLIALIIKQVSKSHLMELYGIPTFKKSEDFLQKIAKATGKLQKGGVANMHATAKQVINDLRGNKILFYNTFDKQK